MFLIGYMMTKKNIKWQLQVGKIMKNLKWNKIVGLIMLCPNSILVYNSLNLYYLYNFTSGILFLIMFPNWVLIVNALLGIVGITISILLYKGKIGFKLFLLATILIWFIVQKIMMCFDGNLINWVSNIIDNKGNKPYGLGGAFNVGQRVLNANSTMSSVYIAHSHLRQQILNSGVLLNRVPFRN